MPVSLPLILGGAQLLSGIFGKKPKRPTYQIPGEARQALGEAKTLASNTVRPGNEQAVADINRNYANSVGNAQSITDNATDILGVADRANANRSQAINQNNALNSNFRYNAKLNLQDSLNNFAQYRDKAFQTNKMQPYMDKAETKGALISGGIQNIYGAVQDQQNEGVLRDIYGLPKAQSGVSLSGLSSIFKKKTQTSAQPGAYGPGNGWAF